MSSHDGKMWIFLTWVWGNPLGGYDTESTPPELSRSDFACEDFFLGKIVILEDQKSANDSLKLVKFFWSSHSRKSQEGKFSSLWDCEKRTVLSDILKMEITENFVQSPTIILNGISFSRVFPK